MEQPKLLYSAEGAAAVLSLGRSKVFELMARGAIESIKVGQRRLIPAEALADFIARTRQEAREAAVGAGAV